MTPRIFVSSTYYDLRHVRERLEKFISNYGFEPILFESDKVTYKLDKKPDVSAYYEVTLCHFMILIIGGRYGSPSTQQNIEAERKLYDEQFISVTQKEYESACKCGIPTVVFIDKNVYAEYHTYKANEDLLEAITPDNEKNRQLGAFKFAHVDSKEIFKFIDLVKGKAFKTFERVEEIENYLKLQFAGMFYLYLESLKVQSTNQQILSSVSELNSITMRMNEMLSSVGKQILGKEYEQVIESQLRILIDFYSDQFVDLIITEVELKEEEFNEINIAEVIKILYEGIKYKLKTEKGVLLLNEFNSQIREISIAINKVHKKLLFNPSNFRNLKRIFETKVEPFIKSKKEEDMLVKGLTEAIRTKLDPCPF